MDLEYDNKKSPQQIMFSAGIKLTAVMFIALVIATECCQKDNREKADETISKIDDKIAYNRHQIDSLYTAKEQRIQDSLVFYPDYQYVEQNKGATDSLRIANIELLDSAYKYARSNSLVMAPQHNESLFTDFADMPMIEQIRHLYYNNKQKINTFDRHKRALGTIPYDIRRYIDSATYAQITQLQNQIDSLLNQKDKIITSKYR